MNDIKGSRAALLFQALVSSHSHYILLSPALKMSLHYNRTVTHKTAEVGGQGLTYLLLSSVQDIGIVYLLSSLIIGSTLLYGFKSSLRILYRIAWFFDWLVGGAPHMVSIPGPPGLPIVGNLLEVCRSSLATSQPFFAELFKSNMYTYLAEHWPRAQDCRVDQKVRRRDPSVSR